jgi:branched-chain amino acid transport system ATP-binding protein
VLGRALMAQPSVLLLDEPLMGLAPGTADIILAELRAIADGGAAVIVVEHNRAALARYADPVIEVAGGQVLPRTEKSVPGERPNAAGQAAAAP